MYSTLALAHVTYIETHTFLLLYRTADPTFVPSFVPTYYVSILQSQISFVVLDQASLTLFLAFLNDYQSISADPRR